MTGGKGPQSDVAGAGETAAELFCCGWNCAEAVFLAICRQIGEDDRSAHLLTALGGGIGDSGRTCGALTGAVVALGLRYGRRQPDTAAKHVAYAKAHRLYKAFHERFHSIECRELINRGPNETTEYEPCAAIVRYAAELVAASLAEA